MNQSDETRFAEVLTGLAETYGQKLTPGTLQGYRIALGDLSLTEITAAVRMALRASEYMPRPSELRDYVHGGEGRAGRAWLELDRAVIKHGRSASVCFQDGLINAVVRELGGWARPCSIPARDYENWYRREFLATYTRLVRQGVAQEQCRYLCGDLEMQNGGYTRGQLEQYGVAPTVAMIETTQKVLVEHAPIAIEHHRRGGGVRRIGHVLEQAGSGSSTT